MKQSRQPRRTKAQQPPRDQHRALRLSELPDALTIGQYCGVFQISERQFRSWRAHGCLPVPPLNIPGDLRFSNSAIRAFLDGKSKVSLQRTA